jgi:hypothetical protein
MDCRSLKRLAAIGIALLAIIVFSASADRSLAHAPVHAMTHHHAPHAHADAVPCHEASEAGETGSGTGAIDCCSPAHCQTLLPIATLLIAHAPVTHSPPTHVPPVAAPREQDLTDPPPRPLDI